MFPTSNRLAAGAGLTMDYNIFPNLAVRVTPTFLLTAFSGPGSSIQNNAGFTAGVLYRWGRQ